MLAIEERITNGSQPEVDQLDEIEQLNDDLLTLSLVPKSRWQTLLYLDDIRARNRPIEPPKKPEKAPFFLSSALPTVSRLNTAEIGTNGAVTPAERSRITKLQQLFEGNKLQFSRVLTELGTSVILNLFLLISQISSLSPSQMDLEIRSLTPLEMVPFVNALTIRLKQKRDFELVNSFMACFLRMHGDVVQESGDMELKLVMRKWDQAMKEEEERLGQLVGYCKGVVDFLRSSR